MHTIETFHADEPISCVREPLANSLHQPTVVPPSCIHEPPDDAPPQPTLNAILLPPLLTVMSPESLWLPYFHACLDKLHSVLITSTFQLLWRPSVAAFIIKPADLILHWQLMNDQQRKLHLLRRLFAIISQESTLLCISPAGSYESATQDGTLISQGRR
jgi:hypothetical protein